MRKIRILNVTSTRYGIGGVERLLLDMSDKFDDREFEISYCNLFDAADGEGAFPTELRRRGLAIHEIKGTRVVDIPGMVRELMTLMQRERFDIVHLHMMKASILGWFASRRFSSHAVITRHYTNALIAKHPWPVRRLDSMAVRGMEHVVAISKRVRDDLVSAGIQPG